eukprot:gene7583-8186_t
MKSLRTFNVIILTIVVLILLQTITVTQGARLPTPWNQRYGTSQFVYTEDELSDSASNIVAAADDELPEDDDTIESDEDIEEERANNRRNNRKNKNSAEIQFMITNKMRNTLIQDLGYLSSEVDNMEPQIAAVVIERSLKRPRKGMPASWRKNTNNDRGGDNIFSRWKDGLLSFLRSSVDFTNNSVRPILPVLIVSSLIYFQRDSILFITNSLINSVKSKSFEIFRSKEKRYIDDEEENSRARQRKSPVNRWNGNNGNRSKGKGGLFWGNNQNKNRRISDEEEPSVTIQPPEKKEERSTSRDNTVDIKAYDKVVTQSWLDDLFTSNNNDQFTSSNDQFTSSANSEQFTD